MKFVYTNGVIYTGNEFINSFSVEDGKFKEVGDVQINSEDVVIDLQGKFVTCGFNDSHMHLLNYGNVLHQVLLANHTTALDKVLKALEEGKSKLSEGEWLLGRGWNQDYFEDEHRFPTRYDLDKVSKDIPIYITRACGHAVVVNSKVLEIANITKDTAQVDGGHFDVDINGEPVGIFRETAISMVSKYIPVPTKKQIEAMIIDACKHLNAYGITSVQSDDFGVYGSYSYQDIIDCFKSVEEQGLLTVRVNEQAALHDLDTMRSFFVDGYTTNVGSDFYKIGPLKIIGDGSLGARTAYMLEPYHDDKTTQGILIHDEDSLYDMIKLASQNHMSVAIHAIGDGTFENVLNAYERVNQECGCKDLRHGIVHCQITSKQQVERFAKLGLHAYIQSIFIDYDSHIVYDRVGDLANTSYAFHDYLDLGVHASNGSDCPVELPDVLAGMQCAITRQPIKGDVEPYCINQAYSVKEAIASYTSEGAYASYDENQKGLIKEGYFADFVVLDQNLFEIDAKDIHSVKVLETYLGGKKVF